ncbi:MAG: EF-hand domain-containing protein [Planctomycetes bacterium]|nr:EF-hand domain-containing protein [Planctomycetota bacterium]
MITRHSTVLALFCGSGLLLAGCQSTSTMRQEAAYTVDPTFASFDLDEQHDSNLSYLLEKYDGDGDGRIARSEYDRENDRFDRLDSDGDGFITKEDFQRGGGGMMARMSAMRIQRVLAGYFQDDTQVSSITLDELERSYSEFDANDDDIIDRDEFAKLAPSRKVELPGGDSPMMQRMMGDIDPWDTILENVDADEDGNLARSELLAFFNENAEDGEWAIRNRMGGRRGGRGGFDGRDRGDRGDRGNRGGDSQPDEGYSEPQDGAMIGDMAPDFTLSPPDGGRTVSLSSYRNNLPVALIFGSYT